MTDSKDDMPEELRGTKVEALTQDKAEAIARDLRKAMKGFGTDESALIKLICPLNYLQMIQVDKAYTDTINRNLMKDIKSECSGKFEDILVALISHPAHLDAKLIKKSIKGLGTNEDLLIECVCSRSDWELKAAADAYRKEFDAVMLDEVEDDVGGHLKHIMRNIIKGAMEGGRPTPPDSQIQDDIIRLYKAGEDKIGTNEKVFVEILSGNSRQYCYKLDKAYGLKYGKPLKKVIRDEFRGDLEKALLCLITPLHEYFAERLYKAMKGMGTDEKTLIRVIATQRDKHLRPAAAHFLKTYEKSLKRWVESEVSGDFRKALVTVIESRED